MTFTRPTSSFFFFFNDTATTEIYTLSLHDALPISFEAKLKDWRYALDQAYRNTCFAHKSYVVVPEATALTALDRKSTRLNSSHSQISYAVFCLKKKKKKKHVQPTLILKEHDRRR